MGDNHPSEPSTFPSHRRATLPVPNPTESLWQTSHPSHLAHHRSTPTLPADVDVVVIGSGITGAFCVEELVAELTREEGSGEESQGTDGVTVTDVLVLEARGLCSGATGRNGGHLIPNVLGKNREWEVRGCEDVERVARKLEREERRRTGGGGSGWGGCELRRVEGVSAWWDGEFWGEAKRKARETEREREGGGDRDRFGVKVVEGKKGLRSLGLRDGCVGALVQAWAATLSPYRLVTELWAVLLWEWEVGRREGKVRLNLQTEMVVEEVRRGQGFESGRGEGWEVITKEGIVRAKHVVVAVNGWTSALLERYVRLYHHGAVWLTVRRFTGVIVPTQGQMTALRPPRSWQTERRLLKHDYGFSGLRGQDRVMNDYVVHRPYVDGGHLMCGGGRQWARDAGEGVSDDSYNGEEVVDHLCHLGDQLDLGDWRSLELEAAWTGVMGYSCDGCPWVGGVPGAAGLWLSGAYTGHGMPNAPGCGRHIARLVAAALRGEDWRERENQAIKDGEILGEFVLDEARLARHELSR